MNGKWKVVGVIAAVAVFASVSAVQAWPSDDESGRRRAGKRGRRGDRMGMMMMWKLTDALELDEQTASKLFPMLREFKAQKRQLHQQRRDTIRQMKTEIEKDAADQAIVRQLIASFKQNQLNLVNQRNKELDDLSKILSDEQVAKMIMLVPRFERNARQFARDARTWRRQRSWMPEGWRPPCMPPGPSTMNPGDEPAELEGPPTSE